MRTVIANLMQRVCRGGPLAADQRREREYDREPHHAPMHSQNKLSRIKVHELHPGITRFPTRLYLNPIGDNVRNEPMS